MVILLPSYNSLSGKHIEFHLFDKMMWKIILLVFGTTLIAASVYPSILLMSFEPLKALKGKLSLGIATTKFRRGLVTAQFVFSVTLIIITLVIGKQLKFVREKDPGYERSQTFSFPLNKMRKHIDAIKAELKAVAAIEDVATTDNRLVDNRRTTAGVSWTGKDPNTTFIIHHLAIDEQFIPLMKIQMLEGKNFSGSPTDSAHFILNETAAKVIGMKDPIGKPFKLLDTEGTIIGIVKDFNTASYKEKIEPTAIYYEPTGRFLYVKTSGENARSAIEATNKLWAKYNPGFPFEYSFMDEEYANLYKSDQLTGTLFRLFALMAIFISCLGLFGLATFTTQLMTREIGIRKVLGANVPRILLLISRDFIKLVTIAIVIATPIAWWAMNKWLEGFVYRIEGYWWVFPFAGLLAIGIALLSISFQSLRAALANPVKSLRSE
jgi:putative ABC transport system permease protein